MSLFAPFLYLNMARGDGGMSSSSMAEHLSTGFVHKCALLSIAFHDKLWLYEYLLQPLWPVQHSHIWPATGCEVNHGLKCLEQVHENWSMLKQISDLHYMYPECMHTCVPILLSNGTHVHEGMKARLCTHACKLTSCLQVRADCAWKYCVFFSTSFNDVLWV